MAIQRRKALRTPSDQLRVLNIAALFREEFRVVPARLVDISAGGFGVEVLTPLTAGSTVFVDYQDRCGETSLDLRGWSRVAYCRRCGETVFRVGIAFSDFRFQTLPTAPEEQLERAPVPLAMAA